MKIKMKEIKMKIRSNEEVIKSWIDGKPAEGRNLRTDGNGLHSFGLKIGFTVQEDDIESDTMKYVYGYKGEFFISNATSKHVRSALKMLGLKDGESIIPPGGLRQRIACGEIREKIRNRSRPDMYR